MTGFRARFGIPMSRRDSQPASRDAGRTKRQVLLAIGVPLGMVFGGALQNWARTVLPSGVVKQFFTSALTWQSGPAVRLDFFIGSITFGPAAIDVSLLSAVVAAVTLRWLLHIFE
jgi:hypothetical protein